MNAFGRTRSAHVAALVAASILPVIACSSADAGEPRPTQCNREDRTGTYRLTWTKRSGDCPEMASSLVSLNPDDGSGPACTVHSDVWSEGNCKNERTFTCVDAKEGSTVDAVSVTSQVTANGSRIEGTAKNRITSKGGAVCNGTYGIVYVRE